MLKSSGHHQHVTAPVGGLGGGEPQRGYRHGIVIHADNHPVVACGRVGRAGSGEGLGTLIVTRSTIDSWFSRSSYLCGAAAERRRSMLRHMPDRGQVLAQICRSLRPGSRLVLTDSFARAPIPVAKQPTVNRFFNYPMATIVQAEDYPPLLRHVGLWFEEILDISEQTLRNSYIWWSRWTKRQTSIKVTR
jgi:hypothetical protein